MIIIYMFSFIQSTVLQDKAKLIYQYKCIMLTLYSVLTLVKDDILYTI